MQTTSKIELTDEIQALQDKRDVLGFEENDQIRYEKISDKIHVLLVKLKKHCSSEEYNRILMSL